MISPETKDPNPNPAKHEEHGRRLRSFDEVSALFIVEMFILFGGVLAGFFWAMVSKEAAGWSDAWDMVVGLLLIIACAVRFMFSLRRHYPARSAGALTQTFLKEIAMLFGGLLIGSLWFTIFRETKDYATHLVVMLVMVLIVIVRYLSLVFPRIPFGGDGA